VPRAQQTLLPQERIARLPCTVKLDICNLAALRQHALVSNDREVRALSVATQITKSSTEWDTPLFSKEWTDKSHVLRTKSQLRGVPRSISRTARLPRISPKWRV